MNNSTKLINKVSLELTGSSEELDKELTLIYNSLEVNYPKFHKMNHLCKLGFLAVEQLIAGQNDFMEHVPKDRIATIFVNHSSSISSDSLHAATLGKERIIQSPAVFVYTLPNILNGELAIRHGWTGYNAFYLKNNFDDWFLKEQLELAILSQPIVVCIMGWVETNLEEGKYRCHLELLQTDQNQN